MSNKGDFLEGWNLELNLIKNFLINSGGILEIDSLELYFSIFNLLDSISVSAVNL